MMTSARRADVELEALSARLPDLSDDEDDLESGSQGGLFADDTAPLAAPGTMVQYRACFWAVSAAASLYTTKRLMVNCFYHYPLSLTGRTLTTLLVACIIRLSVESDPSSGGNWLLRRWTVKVPSLENILVKGWTAMVPAAVMAAASLPLLMQGLLHMPSLLVMVMLSPLVYVVSRAVLFLCRPQHRPIAGLIWEVCIAGAVLSIVLYDEYRLMVPGLVLGVPGIIAAGASRAFFILGSEYLDGAQRLSKDAFHGFVCLVAIVGLCISVPLSYMIESPTPVYAFWSPTTLLLFINRCSLVAAMLTGVSPVAFSSDFSYGPVSRLTETPKLTLDILTTTCSSILVLLAAIFSSTASYMSLFQLMAYLTATLILLACSGQNGPGSARDLFGSWIRSISNSATHRGTGKSASNAANQLVPAIVVLTTIFLSGSFLWVASLAVLNTLPPGLPPRLDKDFVAQSRFDIVVSMYDENPASVGQMLSSIKSTALLTTLQPRVVIYTKSAGADLESLKAATGADIVEKIENAGREGGTYLYHIVNKWDTLADQTMFIQAHAHNTRELIPRIDNFLVANTGMLSLGFTGVVCDCETCTDRWGWHDSLGVVPTLYKAVHHRECSGGDGGGGVLLSYKGQFVASGRRIRGVARETYQGLLEAITSKGGWSHDANAIGGGGGLDTPDAPFFGYTVERVWNLLMQCSDMRIARLCPSLLSRWRRGGDVGDCQCLDPM